jgi:F0F1-type ATP synthase assembly protein I
MGVQVSIIFGLGGGAIGGIVNAIVQSVLNRNETENVLAIGVKGFAYGSAIGFVITIIIMLIAIYRAKIYDFISNRQKNT